MQSTKEARPQLKLYFDVLSPFGYIAFHVVKNSSVFAECEVDYVPVSLAAIMKTSGNTPPLTVKNKGAYLQLERMRYARRFDIPMRKKMPEVFPFNSADVQRALCALYTHAPSRVGDVAAALYEAIFAHGELAYERTSFTRIFERVLGEADARRVLEQADSEETRQRLARNTRECVEKDGAFGLPWFVATNAQGKTEHYWGVDHLGVVAEHLGLGALRVTDKPFSALL